MGKLKLKHVFRGPAKVLREVARSGILGTDRNGKFRVAGIPIGQDLVPVIQTGLVITATTMGAPLAATTLGTTTSVGEIVAGSVSNGVITGVSGGTENDVIKSVVIGGATASVSQVVGAMPTLEEKILTSAVGGTIISTCAGENPTQGLIVGALTSAIPKISDNLYINNGIKGAITGGISAGVTDEKDYKRNSNRRRLWISINWCCRFIRIKRYHFGDKRGEKSRIKKW